MKRITSWVICLGPIIFHFTEFKTFYWQKCIRHSFCFKRDIKIFDIDWEYRSNRQIKIPIRASKSIVPNLNRWTQPRKKMYPNKGPSFSSSIPIYLHPKVFHIHIPWIQRSYAFLKYNTKIICLLCLHHLDSSSIQNRTTSWKVQRKFLVFVCFLSVLFQSDTFSKKSRNCVGRAGVPHEREGMEKGWD